MTNRPSRSLGVAVWLLLVVVAGAAGVEAQTRRLTLDEIFHPQRRVAFGGSLPRITQWLDDEHYLERVGRRDSADAPLVRVHAESGRREPFFDAARTQAALAARPEIDEAAARTLAWGTPTTLDVAGRRVVVTHDGDLYLYPLDGDEVIRLTDHPGAEAEVSFSPDGTHVAFVRDHDLHVVAVDGTGERRLTHDGSDRIRNGILDWVYQEEIYGRGNFRGYWWSPTSSRLAFLQLDDRGVPDYTIVDHIDYHPEVEVWEYPKAGDPNPGVRLGVVSTGGGETTWLDLGESAPDDRLVVDVGWTPDGEAVVFQLQNREQTWLDLYRAPPGEAPTRLLRETTEAWVNVLDAPSWLDDGSFLWRSERSGWSHLYHHEADGTLRRAVTEGEWELRQVHGVDEAGGWVYFSGTEHNHLGGDVYRVSLAGGAPTRLSEATGTHRARFSPGLSRYLDTWSRFGTPSQLRLHGADGVETRVVAANAVPALDELRLTPPELVTVPTRDGGVMDALLIRPPDFDPTRTYPVYQHVYGGPHAPRVRDAWGGPSYLFWQLLAQEGVIVWVLDTRTASGRGAVSAWPVYEQFGAPELQDLEDGIAWLRAQPYVDPDRIGIEGWSYGGFMVSYALTHSQSWSMGIAGGSVTDWRDYDTIYTERYMRRPQHNEEGYRRSSPRFAAADLHGALLLIHGTMDENVHMQNTLQFAYALQQAGKRFDMMIYPKSRHRLGGPALEHHRHLTMLDFVRRHLRPEPTPASRSDDAP